MMSLGDMEAVREARIISILSQQLGAAGIAAQALQLLLSGYPAAAPCLVEVLWRLLGPVHQRPGAQELAQLLAAAGFQVAAGAAGGAAAAGMAAEGVAGTAVHVPDAPTMAAEPSFMPTYRWARDTVERQLTMLEEEFGRRNAE